MSFQRSAIEIDQLAQEAELSPSKRDEFHQKIDAARKEADALMSVCWSPSGRPMAVFGKLVSI